MKKERSSGRPASRLQELQERFRDLEPAITDMNTKKALSMIYGMLQETWRKMERVAGQGSEANSIDDILNLYRHAPRMEGKAMNQPLEIGTTAPDFELRNSDGTRIKLSDYREFIVLLVFYPLDWSPGCSQQLDLYQSELPEFEKRNVKILAISVDSIYSHGAWSETRKIAFPLLSDFNPKGEVARKYQVFRDEDGFSERALFVIDRKGKIRFSYVSPYLHHIPDIYELFGNLDEIIKPAITV